MSVEFDSYMQEQIAIDVSQKISESKLIFQVM